MRIAFLTYGALEQTTGGYIYDRHLVTGLRAAGHQVWPLAMAREDRGWPAQLVDSGKAEDPAAVDVVIEDELIHPSLADTRGWAAGPRPRVISLVHNLTCLQPATAQPAQARARERAYFAGADGVVAVCADTLAGVREVSGRDESQLPAVVAHPGADHLGGDVTPDIAVARARAPGPLRVLFVGTITAAKGPHRLLEALAGLPAEMVELDLAGRFDVDPAYVAELRQEIVRRRLSGQVRLYGELGGDELARLYHESHLLALPSDREAYPLVTLEAMGFGLPVLLTAAGGTREVLADSDAGLLLAPDDRAAWAGALADLAGDRPRLAAMSLAALDRHAEHPRWSHTTAVVNAFLETL